MWKDKDVAKETEIEKRRDGKKKGKEGKRNRKNTAIRINTGDGGMDES